MTEPLTDAQRHAQLAKMLRDMGNMDRAEEHAQKASERLRTWLDSEAEPADTVDVSIQNTGQYPAELNVTMTTAVETYTDSARLSPGDIDRTTISLTGWNWNAEETDE